MTALAMTIGYVACSEDEGTDKSAASPTQQVENVRHNDKTGIESTTEFSTFDSEKYSIKSSQTESLAKEVTSVGLVALRSIEVPDDNSAMVFNLEHYPIGTPGSAGAKSSPSTKTLTVKSFDMSSGFRGFTATLVDAEGKLLWEYAFKTDLVIPHHFQLEERTLSDELLVETLMDDSSYMEIYTQNSVVDTFRFQTRDRDSIQTIHSSLLANNLSRQTTDPMVAELNRFDAFYDTTSSLARNSDGRLVGDFLTSPHITRTISENVIDSAGNLLDYIFDDELCFEAGDCVTLKCPFGADVNPFCDICFSVVVICFIERMFN